MHKYLIVFSKKGMIRYISHLDLQRLFKRAFRRAGIPLKYSEGYHPHAKMGISQPLSLGYDGEREFLEFETDAPLDKSRIMDHMTKDLPPGIEILALGDISSEKKSIASVIYSGTYTVTFPLSSYSHEFQDMVEGYLSQSQITAKKRQKKTKKLKEVDIRPMIRDMHSKEDPGNRMVLSLELDTGSSSNLSPELVIETFNEYCDLGVERYEIDVCRNGLSIPVDYQIHWM